MKLAFGTDYNFLKIRWLLFKNKLNFTALQASWKPFNYLFIFSSKLYFYSLEMARSLIEKSCLPVRHNE